MINNESNSALRTLVLCITEAEDQFEDRVQEKQAEEESEALAESLCEFIFADDRNDTADQAEHVDAAIENGIDDPRLVVGQAELGAEEERKDRIHDVVAKAFTHVAERRGQQSFRMVFEHMN